MTIINNTNNLAKSICTMLIVIIVIQSCQMKKQLDEKTDALNPLVIEVVNNGNVNFGQYFLDKTMRVDYFHTGNSNEELFSVDKVLTDGEWGGSIKILVDTLNLGLYFFEVVDRDSHLLLYSRGFASIFGEWQTIPEADEKWGTFHESIRLPWPKKPITIIMKKRDSENKFQPIWTTDIDPDYRQVIKTDMVHQEKVDVILENGPAHEKLDIVILGDGYSYSEMEKFRNDATRLSNYMMKAEPFKSHKKNINVRAVETPGIESGVSKPHHGIYKHSSLSVSYSAFDSERYALTYDNRTVRNAASAVPYDFMVILINERTYGGGGIYNLYTTVTADNLFAGYTMVHEMGHHMAALADEYYTSSVSYEVPEITIEPWEPNVTALLDKGRLKWSDLVEEGTPIPTTWNKKAFDEYGYEIQKVRDSLRAIHSPESVLEELFIRQKKAEDLFFAQEPYRGKVGAFEGANYSEYGMYRSQLDCIMYTRHEEFCKVCQRSIINVIQQYAQ